MPLRFNQLLIGAGVDPSDTRLMRHQTDLADGRAPLDLWRADRTLFEAYQSYQLTAQRAWFRARWWACFFGTSEGRTMFAGLYAVGEPESAQDSFVQAGTGIAIRAEVDDYYPLQLSEKLSEYSGRLFIDWGGGVWGKRSWKQLAGNQDKVITELHLDVAEEPFPGLLELAAPVSRLMAAPPSWIAQLQAARGIYLLSCPRTGELYVGKADGTDGFWGRWVDYAANGHGGNVALMARDRTDWIASVLQVAGSADTSDDISAMEGLWKRKLQSRAFGLNRN